MNLMDILFAYASTHFDIWVWGVRLFCDVLVAMFCESFQ